MILIRFLRLRICYVLISVTLLTVMMINVNAQEEVIVINNPQMTDTLLSTSALRGVFGMRLHNWPETGTPIKVFVLEDQHPLHENFARTILSIFPHQLRNAWDRVIYSGIGQAPNVVASEQEMLNQVATTAGAVGYISRTMVNNSVRIVEISRR